MKNIQKVAIVTGAGSGIGRAASLALFREGYRVVLAGRRVENLQQTLAQRLSGAEGIVVPTDVARPPSVRELFMKTLDHFGRLDLLFNNAGTAAAAASIEDIPYDQWQAVVEVNLTGMFLCTQEAFRIMKSQTPRGGRIINNGSIAAHSPRPDSAAYTATKHAVTGLTKATSLDGRKYDIACGQIDIGNAATDLTARMKEGIRQPHGAIMVEPRMDVEQAAQAIVYMASLPLETNVQFMTIMATKMPFIGRG